MTDHQTQPRQRSAWDALLRIISRPKWQGPGPEPSEDETMEMVVDEIKRMRQEGQRRREGRVAGVPVGSLTAGAIDVH